MRLPPPLACAVALAGLIAIAGAPRPTGPRGTTPDDRVDDTVAGTIGGPCLRSARGAGAPLDTGDATVWIWTTTPLEPGDRARVTGLLRTRRGLLDPGIPAIAPDFELTAKRVERLGEDHGAMLAVWRWAARTQRAWAARVPRDDAASAALRGIVTGDRASVPAELDQRWRAVGIFHVLSVSGLHLAVVAGLAFVLLRRLIAASPWGGRIRPARWAAPLAIALAIAYTLVTGAQLATLRSLVVVVIVLAGQVLERPVRVIDALGVAAIALLVWRPQDLFDPSFQLSFVAALTLALRPRHRRARRRIVHWLVEGIGSSAWVALTTAPITAYHFHQLAPGGVLGNLVLTPLVELLALPLGLAGIVLGDAGAPFVTAAVWIVARVDDLAGVLAHALPLGTITVATGAVMLLLVACSLWLCTRSPRTRALGWLALCLGWAIARTPAPAGALRVTFLDVGQGDAALVELPDHAVWLIDAGGLASSHDLAAASAPGRAIARTLAAYGHASIDRAIISHPHPDHVLGLAALAVPIRELWYAESSPAFAAITRELAARGTRLVRPALGTTRRAGVELTVWAPRYRAAPDAPDVLAPDPVRSVNDNSLVVSLRYAGRAILFAGDIEREGEDELIAAGLPAVDVVKVAHHGSRTSSSAPFVVTTHPHVAVISCGVANTFGFPAPEVVERWRAVGALVQRTDRDGAVIVTVGADGGLVVDRLAP